MGNGSSELNDHGDYGSCFSNISPREIKLGKRQWKKFKNGKRRIAEYPDRFYYTSLLSSLEVLLNTRKILDMVARPRVSEPNSSLCDFTDGTAVQNHELFSVDPQSLKVIFRPTHMGQDKPRTPQ